MLLLGKAQQKGSVWVLYQDYIRLYDDMRASGTEKWNTKAACKFSIFRLQLYW